MRHSAVYTPPPASWLTLTGEGTLSFATTVNTTLPLTGVGAAGFDDTVNAGLALTGEGSVAMGYSTNLDLSTVGTVAFIARPSVSLTETGTGTVAFSGAPNVTLPETGTGTLSFATKVNTTLALTGGGALSLPAAPSFVPSGMYKNGTQSISTSGTYGQITSWTADTTNYPGSSVVSNGLIAQNSKTGATLTANIPFTGSFSQTVTVRIKVNGTVVVTGSGVNAASGTATASTTYNIASGDSVTVEATTSGLQTQTISSGTGTWVRIT